MNMEEEVESAPGGADKTKKRKKKRTTHVHIGPYARAYRAGLAFCPACDAERNLRFTDRERSVERTSRDFERTKKSRPARS